MFASPAVAPPAPPLRLTREEVAALCRQAAQDWDDTVNRNLALFFDGTGNILGDSGETNVVKLWEAAAKSARQIGYYDPGVGTSNDLPPDSPLAGWRQSARRLGGLALGGGVFDNIADGYRFLVEHYRDGDRIFLFGFSRGAFTARAVGGMVNMYGLIHDDGLPMLPAMVNTYFADASREGQAGLREAFTGKVQANLARGRFPLLHFVGVWDTVETVGGMTGLHITNSSRIDSKRFVHIRHALALHETRRQYQPRAYAPPQPPYGEAERGCRSFDQRWFRGVHSDIGGSYLDAGLSDLTLRWMMHEAAACGLLLDTGAKAPVGDPAQPLHDQTLASPLWALTGLDARPRGAQEVIDPSALPVAGAHPARRHGRAAHGLGAACMALVLAGLAWLWHGLAQSPPAEAGAWLAADPVWLRRLLAAGGLILLGGGLCLAWPLAWAARRMAPGAIVHGRRLPWLARGAHVPPLAMVLLGALAVLLALHGVFVVVLPFALALGVWSAWDQWRAAGDPKADAAKPSGWRKPQRWLLLGAAGLVLMAAMHYGLRWPVLAVARWGVLALGAAAALVAGLAVLALLAMALRTADHRRPGRNTR